LETEEKLIKQKRNSHNMKKSCREGSSFFVDPKVDLGGGLAEASAATAVVAAAA
jgi:hypothetical protein